MVKIPPISMLSYNKRYMVKLDQGENSQFCCCVWGLCVFITGVSDGFVLFSLLAFLPSVIFSFFFTQNKGWGSGLPWSLQ